jgi:hypothetical protein
MKTRLTIATLTMCSLFLLSADQMAMAAKPFDVIAKSNGYPSGPHFNLNIHGKDSSTSTCDPTSGGNSVFISEYGESTIQYLSNRNSGVTELTALDPCGEVFDGSPALVQIPSATEGYYVYAAVKGKPDNGSGGEASSVILSPNLVTDACNDTDPENPDFPTYTACPDDDLMALGLIVGDNLYEATDRGFVRFDATATGGKGKSRAVDISSLFTYTGWVYDISLDINGDGAVDVLDAGDYNSDGVLTEEDFTTWQSDMQLYDLARYFENEWIQNIADLVVSDQVIVNDGAKLLKIRFYPVSTTVFSDN